MKPRKVGAIRGIELVVPFHNALHITQFKLVVAVELLDDFAILVPVVGSAGPENGRWLTDGRRLRGEGHGRWWRVRVHDELTLLINRLGRSWRIVYKQIIMMTVGIGGRWKVVCR